MPRMSDAEKQRSHNRILDAAARLFRQNGIGSTSVTDVMKAAGMTHGGFYRHFDSKEDLIAAAFNHAVDDVVSDMEQQTTRTGRGRARKDYIEKYLSQAHVKDSGQGCPLAAMATELARTGGDARNAGAAASARMANLLQINSDTGPKQGLAVMALLLGAVTLARLGETAEAKDHALEAGRTGLQLLQDHWPLDKD